MSLEKLCHEKKCSGRQMCECSSPKESDHIVILSMSQWCVVGGDEHKMWRRRQLVLGKYWEARGCHQPPGTPGKQQPITAVWQHTPAGREECVLLPQITSKRPSSSQTVEYLFCGLDGQVRASSLQPGSLSARRFSQDSPNVEVVCPWVQPEWKNCATHLILEIFMLLKSQTPTANTHVRVDKVFSTALRVSDIHEFFWTLLYL